MGTYAIGDIHGCYAELQRMLERISFSDADRLILLGDYVDRGPDSLAMLRWLERSPPNVTAIRGNHDDSFVSNVELLELVDGEEGLDTDPASPGDAAALYDTAKYVLARHDPPADLLLDPYGTLDRLVHKQGVTLADLRRWAERIQAMPCFARLSAGGREWVAVHAGFKEGGFSDEAEAKDFFMNARGKLCWQDAPPHVSIVAGHTPTLSHKLPGAGEGRVYRHYSPDRDVLFYDIDCGCAYRKQFPNGRLACLRLEDEAVFYV